MKTIKVFTRLSGAWLCCSTGSSIQCLTYDTETKKGSVVFSDVVKHVHHCNYLIVYTNEYGKEMYTRLMGAKLDHKGEVLPGLQYTFTYSNES